MQDNKQFWDNQADAYRDKVKAVNFDFNAEELELQSLTQLLQDNQKICDIGCGNGQTIFHMIKNNIKSEFYGIDFTKGMIDIAIEQKNKHHYKNATFYNMSATNSLVKEKFDFQFDTIYSKRLLINLKGDDKYSALDNIYHMLKDNGRYIMIENFNEPLQNINHVREFLNLDTIKVHHFNEYLNEDFLNTIGGRFMIERKIDFNSLYYFISRIFNAALSEEQTPEYNTKINQIAIDISKQFNIPIKGYSPQVIYVLKKVIK